MKTLRLAVVLMVFLCVKAQAGHLVFYPPQHTAVYFEGVAAASTANAFQTLPLPKGVLPQSVILFEPENTSYMLDQFPTSQESLMTSFEGKSVSYVGKNATQKGTLLASIQGQPVLRIDDHIVLNPQGELWASDASHIPQNALLLLKNSETSFPVSLSYVIDTIESSVVYHLDYDEMRGSSLRGVLQLTNRSGKSFPGSTLELRLGDSPFLRPQQPRMYMAAMAKAASFSEPEVKQSDESYRFSFPDKISIPTSGILSIPLFSKQPVNPLKEYRFEPPAYVDANKEYQTHAQVSLEFTNSTAFPLPSGTIKLYENRICFGEVRLSELSKNEKTTIPYGKAFDVICSKQLVETHKNGPSITEEYLLVINNQKDVPINIDCVDSVTTNKWTVLESNVSYKRMGDYQLLFSVDIPAQTTTTINYTIQK